MGKSRERNELEALRAANRALHKEVQSLRKEVSRNRKREYIHEDLEEKLAERATQAEHRQARASKKEQCSECLSDKLKISDIGIRRITTCEMCGHRKIEKV